MITLAGILRHQVDFPSLSSLFLILLLFLFAVGVFQRRDLGYLADTAVSRIYGQAIVPKAEGESDTNQAVSENNARAASKVELDVATLVMWGVFGMVLYYCAEIFKHLFIDPFVHDRSESGFIHADKQQLKIKRLLWVSGVFACMILAIGITLLFKGIILTYAVLSIYQPSVLHFAYFIGGLLIATITSAFLVLTIRTTYRAY